MPMKTTFIFVSVFMSALLLTHSVSHAQAPEKMSYQAVIRNANGELVKNHEAGIRISIRQGSSSGEVVFREIYNPNPQTNGNGLVTLEIGSGIALTGSFPEIDWSAGPYFLQTETDPSGGTTYSIISVSELLSVPYALYAESVSNQGSTHWQDGDGVVTTAERVGIGTHTPTGKLEIRGSHPDDGVSVTIGNSDDTHAITIFGGRENDPNPFIRWSDGDPLRFSTTQNGWDEKMRITGDGNVGIGISKVSEKLEVNGNVDVHNNYIQNVADPLNGQDAATKAYVDLLESKVSVLENKLISANILVKDIDGNIYNTVQIGNQLWMAENMKTTKYRNGTPIPYVSENSEWNNISNTGAFAWYNNDDSLKNTYGGLYNFYTLSMVCPEGWRVPTDSEWNELITFLGGESVAGGKMKETGTVHWQTPNTGASNQSRFTALPGGSRWSDGTFHNIETGGVWWSSTMSNPNYFWVRNLSYNTSTVSRHEGFWKYGYSVRCIKL